MMGTNRVDKEDTGKVHVRLGIFLYNLSVVYRSRADIFVSCFQVQVLVRFICTSTNVYPAAVRRPTGRVGNDNRQGPIHHEIRRALASKSIGGRA